MVPIAGLALAISPSCVPMSPSRASARTVSECMGMPVSSLGATSGSHGVRGRHQHVVAADARVFAALYPPPTPASETRGFERESRVPIHPTSQQARRASIAPTFNLPILRRSSIAAETVLHGSPNPFTKLRMNCEWVESVPGIAIDDSKRGFPGISHLRIFSNPWFVEFAWQQRRRLVEHRRGIAPPSGVPDPIQSDGAAFGSDLENDLGLTHG
jgi:hypothetical protein